MEKMNFRSDLVIIEVKVGISEFLNGAGNGVETHVAKLESEIGDFQKLLVFNMYAYVEQRHEHLCILLLFSYSLIISMAISLIQFSVKKLKLSSNS